MERENLIQLVKRAQAGDSEAFSELYNAFHKDIYYIALRETKDADLANDITQETYIEIIQTIEKLKEPAAFVTWAKMIAYHQCTRYYKKKEVKHETLLTEDEDLPPLLDSIEEENEDFIPDKALDNEEFRKTIMSFIDALPDAQRSAILMKFYDGLSIAQIAEIQGVPQNTVLSRINYGKKGIKKAVEDYEKKHEIKLHAIPFLPFLKWIFDGTFDALPGEVSTGIAEGVSTATGTTITVSANATAQVSAATGQAGLLTQIAQLPIVTKIIAGVVAVIMVVTVGFTTLLPKNKPEMPTGTTEGTYSSTEGTQGETEDNQNYYLIDPFESIDYICYVDGSDSFVVRQTDSFSKEYENGWIIHNTDKHSDDTVYIKRNGASDEGDYGSFWVEEDSYDGNSVTVSFYLSKETLDEYKSLGVNLATVEKKYPVVRGEYVTDSSSIENLAFRNIKGFEMGCRVFFWCDKKDETSDTENLLEFVTEHDWSSMTNTTGCSIYYYKNLIKTETGELITQESGTTIYESQLYGSNEPFVSIDDYESTYFTRWISQSELVY